ncbi:MAG: glycosyltransferase family 2 protein [Acidobacteria bacterium]|nr:glycosyltransferase family 2 protein [Acidobacteriota bacterium]
MKLIIQIPAWNEEACLGRTLDSLPTEIDGFDEVGVQVVDDGSTDLTAEIARDHGAKVVRLPVHRGLAVAFATGLRAAVEDGADVIVNTDADGQYDPRDITALVAPILSGEAQMVIGDRQVENLNRFSTTKKLLQKLGSWVVRKLSHTNVRDATSGFRAITRQTALKLHVFTRFTYTLETILQAGEAGLNVVSVPIRSASEEQRPSRLFKSNLGYVLRSLESLARIVVLYNPLRIFLRIGAIPVTAGAALLLRFLWYFFSGDSPAGHVQSLLLAVVLILVGVQIWVVGIVADLIAVNRRLLEEAVERARDRRLPPGRS